MANKLRELMLLRHAKSDWKNESLEDIERPLSLRGKKNAVKLGKWLSDQNLMPNLILASPAVRAQQTLRRVCSECPASSITVDSLYMAGTNDLLSILSEAPTAERVMLIGHNPGLESLLKHLVEQSQDQKPQLFPTCALAHLVMPEDWTQIEAGSARLQQFTTPKKIKNYTL